MASLILACAVALALFFVPGYLAQRLLFAREPAGGLGLVPLSFALSLGVAAPAWGLAQLVDGRLETFAYLLIGATAALAAWNLATARRRARAPKAACPDRLRQAWWPLVLVAGTIAFWVVVAACYGALFMPETDNWYYLAIARHTAQTRLLAPGDPYFAGVADPQRGGPWIALVALVIRASGAAPAAVWNALPALLMPAAILAHYLLAMTLFRDRLAAAIACVFLLYGFGRYTWDAPMMVVAPAGVGFCLFLVCLALAWRYLRGGDRGALAAAVLAGWALAAIHLLVFAGLAVAIAAYAVLHLLAHRNAAVARRAAALVAVAVLLAVPFAQSWTGGGLQTANATYADEWGLLSEFAGWHILRPGAIVGSGASPAALAFLLGPVLLVLARRHDWALLLLSTELLAVGLAFNPLFVELMLRTRLVPPWGVWRMVLQVFQFQLVLGGLGAMGLRWLHERLGREWGGRPAARAALLAGCLGLAFLPSAVPLAGPLLDYAAGSVAALRGGAQVTAGEWWQRFEPLAALPAGSVILADANTGYIVSALVEQCVVAIPYGHSSPFVGDDDRRRQDAARALDPRTDLEEVRAILDRYGVDYVLVALPSPALGDASPGREAFEQAVARFEADPAHFQRVQAQNDGPAWQAVLFAYRPGEKAG